MAFLRRCLMGDRMLIFSPHPDDETFGCGGTIAKRVREGYTVLVVLFTNGEQAYYQIPGVQKSLTLEEFLKIRREEVINALKILGLEKNHLIFLDFKDGNLWQVRKEAEDKALELLRGFSPAEVYCTYKRDAHADHRAASHILRNVIKKFNQPITAYYEYSISHKYCFIGACLDKLLKTIRHKIFHVDISDFLELKSRAIKEFQSQISIISREQKKPIVRHVQRFLKSKEVFWISK